MKASLFGLSVVLVAAFTAACGSGDQDGTTSSGTAGTGTGGSSTGGTGTGGPSTGGTGGASTGGTGGASTGGASTGGTSTGSGGGQPCGGKPGGICESGDFCDFPDDLCAAADGQGVCTAKPEACPDNVDPVCACNGVVFNNACEAQAAGYDVQALGGCTPPDGQFACGPGFCAEGGEYCQVQLNDVAGQPHIYSCKPLPANCVTAGATCSCLSGAPCGDNCQQTETNFTLTCPGG